MEDIISNTFIEKIIDSEYAKSIIKGNDLLSDKINNGEIDNNILTKIGIVSKQDSNTNTISSSDYSGAYAGYKAFDRNASTYWCSVSGQQNDAYIGYDFKENQKITFATLTSEPSYKCKEMKLQFSDDSENWQDASEIITLASNKNTVCIKNTKETEGHRYWRIYVISSYNSQYSTAREIQFYGTNNNNVREKEYRKVKNLSYDIIYILGEADTSLEFDDIITVSLLSKLRNLNEAKQYAIQLNVVDKILNNNSINVLAMIPKQSGNPNTFSSSDYSTTYSSDKAFDGIEKNYWCTASGKQNDAYIGYDFKTGVYIHSVSFYNGDGSNYRCKEVKLQCSNDKVEWKDASDVITLENASKSTFINNNLSNNEMYRYWRVYIISSYHTSYSGSKEIQFYGL